MAVEQIDIGSFLAQSALAPVLDVRSPGEYLHAHIPGALSFPLFTDEERKVIGTTYKQQSRQAAVLTGLEYFAARMQPMLSEVQDILRDWHARRGSPERHLTPGPVLVHCWRGGMRSGAIAWLLDLYGFKVYQLKGGYKAYRNWVLTQFEKSYNFHVLGGFTGSGKTGLLEGLKEWGAQTIDLESLAHHKGSAFGWLGEPPQPGQEMFENLLAMELSRISHREGTSKGVIWLEDESRHIGSVGIPPGIWNQMRLSPLYFLDIPFESRLEHIVRHYGAFSAEDLISSIKKIEKRMGGLETRDSIKLLKEGRIRESFDILLRYYDKLYYKSLHNREKLQDLLNKIPCQVVDKGNVKKLMAYQREPSI